MMLRLAVPAVMLLGCASTATTTANPAQELRYTVELKTTATAQMLVVEVAGLGFASGDSLVAYLYDWGSWTELGRPYLQNVIVRGRPVALTAAGTIPLGTGPFVLRYELPVLGDTSADARRHSLLPHGAPGTAIAAVRNTLVEIRRGGERVAARASIRLAAPRTGGTFSGWAGFSADSQSAPVLPVGATENGFYAFGLGEPAIRSANGVRIEVASTADAARRANDVADLAARLLPVLHTLTGERPDTVVGLILQRSGLPGVFRGTASQFGVAVLLPPDDDWSEWVRGLVAHEISHLWIGRRFSGDEGLIWFMEGFNDYFSLFAATAAGVVSPEWFAQRLALIGDNIAALPPSPPRPLTARGAVGRDKDGPAELMGYGGGALAAFRFDLALRAGNKGTLGGFIGKLLSRPEFLLTEEAIVSTARALGATAELDAAVGSPLMLSPWAALRSIGYVFTEEIASLVALGIAADALGRPSHLTMGPAVVRAIDPQGPSAAADIVPGDTVIIRADRRRSYPPTHDAALTAVTLGEYVFGSSVVPSDARTVTLEVRRNGETRTVSVTPRLVGGGVRLTARWDSSNGSSFFKQ
jgi:hypothetical protein